MTTKEAILKKLDRLDQIPQKGYNVRGKPQSIQTILIDGETLVVRWYKRVQKYKINLIEAYAKEACKEQRKICAARVALSSKNSLESNLALNAPEPKL